MPVSVVLVVLCLLAATQAQEVGVTSLAIKDADSVTYTAGAAGQTITVTIGLAEDGGASTDGVVTAISFYFTDSEDFGNAQTLKSTPVTHTLTPSKTVSAGATDSIVDEPIDSVSIDVENCQAYTHVCIEITATDDTDDSDDFFCLGLGATTNDAGLTECPDIAASAFTITGPSAITYDTANDTDITFGISATATDGDGTVTGVKLYFTDSDDYDTASTTSVAFDAGNVASTSVSDGDTDPIAGATASLKLDAANCDDYTHVCAVLQISSTDTITNNNDVCIAFGTEAVEAGSKNCGAGDTSTETSTAQEATTPGDSANSVSSFSIQFLLFFAIAAKFVM